MEERREIVTDKASRFAEITHTFSSHWDIDDMCVDSLISAADEDEGFANLLLEYGAIAFLDTLKTFY